MKLVQISGEIVCFYPFFNPIQGIKKIVLLLAPIVRWWCCKARRKSWSASSCQDPRDQSLFRQLQQKSAKVKKLLRVLLNPSNPEPTIFMSSLRASSITSLLARWIPPIFHCQFHFRNQFSLSKKKQNNPPPLW